MRQLQRKKIGMSAGSGKDNSISNNLVNKEPVPFNMKFPIMFPYTFELVIFISGGKNCLSEQQRHCSLELWHIFAAIFRFLEITLELRGIIRLTHLTSQLSEKIIKIFRVMNIFTSVYLFQRFPCQGIGDFLAERQALFTGDSRQRHAQCIGNGKSPIRKNGAGCVLDGRINSGANNGVSRHIFSPFGKCSPNVRVVKSRMALNRGECHGLI